MNFHRTLLSGIKVYISNRLNTLSKEIKAEIPTKVSELENDKEYLTEHQDLSDYAKTEDLTEYAQKDEVPTTLSDLSEDETHRLVTDEEKESWNNKSEFSGKWDDLENKPFGEVSSKYYYETLKNVSHNSFSSNIFGLVTQLRNTTDAIVELDGVKYTNVPCILQARYDMNSRDYYIIGNPYLFTQKDPSKEYVDNGLPFCIWYQNGGLGRILIPNIEGEVTFEMYKEESDIKQLDEKFIPDTIARIEELNILSDSINTKVTELQTYADNSANTVKNDLLNGAGEAYDTLKELGELIDENQNALEALETVATGKADKEHEHSWGELTDKPFGNVDSLRLIYDGIEASYELRIYDGKEYVVKYNGIEYRVVGQKEANAVGMSNIYIGSLSPSETSTYPFQYYYDFEADITYIHVADNCTTIELYDIVKQTKQLDEQYIPDTIARVEDIPETMSWNNITDKPFGEAEGISLTTTGQQTTIESFELGTEGTSYTIIFDGQEYLCQTIVYQDVYGSTHLCLGNPNGMFDGSSDNGLPFGICNYYGKHKIFVQDSSVSHDVKIYLGEGISVKTIDEKYIPDTIARNGHTHSYDELTDVPCKKVAEYVEIYYGLGELNENIVSCQVDCHLDEYKVKLIVDDDEKIISLDYRSPVGHYNDFQIAGYNARVEYAVYDEKITVSIFDVTVEKFIELYAIAYDVMQLEDIYISDNIARAEDIVQADYDQNNPDTLSYIQNRPFYEETYIVEVVSEQSLVIDEEGYLGIDGVSSQLTSGQTYHVTFNGIEYDCVARKSGDAVLIGNGTIYGDGNVGNNEPFACDSYNDGAIYLNAAPGEYTLSITETVSDVHYLDHKYIKDMYYEEKTDGSTLTWDGITEGLFKVEVMEDFYLYKISDATPTLNECMENCTAAITTSTGVLTDIQCIVIPFDSEQKYNAHVILANNSALYVINEDGMMLDGAIFAEKGIYTDIRDNSYISNLTINGYDGFSKIKKIDEKYMTGSVASKTYVKNQALIAANEHSAKYEYFPRRSSDLATKEYVDQVGYIPMSHFTLVDTATGYNYIVEMNNGSLISYCYDITNIFVATPPASLVCGEGGMIDTTGMVVNATCADGSTRPISGYTCTSVKDGIVTIQYVQNGQLYTTTLEVTVIDGLGDFTYAANDDGTLTLTGWKGTTNGVKSTEIVFPDDARVIL